MTAAPRPHGPTLSLKDLYSLKPVCTSVSHSRRGHQGSGVGQSHCLYPSDRHRAGGRVDGQSRGHRRPARGSWHAGAPTPTRTACVMHTAQGPRPCEGTGGGSLSSRGHMRATYSCSREESP